MVLPRLLAAAAAAEEGSFLPLPVLVSPLLFIVGEAIAAAAMASLFTLANAA